MVSLLIKYVNFTSKLYFKMYFMINVLGSLRCFEYEHCASYNEPRFFLSSHFTCNFRYSQLQYGKKYM